MNAPAGLFDLMKKIGATFNVPIFALVVAGILVKKAPTIAAKAILVVGVIFYSFFTWVYQPSINGQEVHWLHITGLNFAILITIMIVMSRMKPSEPVDGIPSFLSSYSGTGTAEYWSGTKIVGSGVVVCVIAMYSYLHWF